MASVVLLPVADRGKIRHSAGWHASRITAMVSGQCIAVLSARAQPQLGTSSWRPRSCDRGLQSHLYPGVTEIQFMIYRSSASRPAEVGTEGVTSTRKPVSTQAR